MAELSRPLTKLKSLWRTKKAFSITLLACRRHGGSRPWFPIVTDRFGFGPSMTSGSVRSNGWPRLWRRTVAADCDGELSSLDVHGMKSLLSVLNAKADRI